MADSLWTRLFDLSGRVAWVVGGGGYLARPVCQLLAEMGAHVVVADRHIDSARQAARAIGGDDASEMDSRRKRTVLRASESIRAKHERLDIVVNMSTFSTDKSMGELSADDFAAGLRVTLTGAFLVAREAAKLRLPCRAGSIIQ